MEYLFKFLNNFSLDSLIEFFNRFGYAAVFWILILCGLGLPVPEDITLVAGGVIAGLNPNISVHTMLAIAFAGVLLGDGIVFFLGRYFGSRVFDNRFIGRLLSRDRYTQVQNYFDIYGKWVVFMGRFMPGLRAPIFLVAGMSQKVSPQRFFITDGFAALISVPIWVYLGYYGSHNFEKLKEWISQGETSILIAISLVIAAVVIKVLWNKKKKALNHG